MADAYLTETVEHLPAEMIFSGRRVRPEVASYVKQGVVRVIAGPTECHVIIDIQRPYFRPERRTRIEETKPCRP